MMVRRICPIRGECGCNFLASHVTDLLIEGVAIISALGIYRVDDDQGLGIALCHTLDQFE